MGEKKKDTKTRFIVIVICIAVVGIGFYYNTKRNKAYVAAENEGGETVAATQTVKNADKLYNDTIGLDLVNHYPETPEEVLGVYLNTSQLLFRAYNTTEEMVEALLKQQRTLFGPELLALNDYDTQLQGLISTIAVYKENKLFSVGTEQKPIIYYDPENNNLCLIRATQYLSDKNNSYRNYYLAKNTDNGRWEITTWETTDGNFVVIP